MIETLFGSGRIFSLIPEICLIWISSRDFLDLSPVPKATAQLGVNQLGKTAIGEWQLWKSSRFQKNNAMVEFGRQDTAGPFKDQ